MRNIEKLIRPYCYKIIPLIYDDSLSYYEVLCKLRAKLNEVIEQLNLNYDIAEEVNRILNEWLEDGTLKTMIDSALDNVQIVYPEYISTTCRKDGRYDDTASCAVMQSFCIISPELGVAVYGQPSGASVYDGEKCELIKFNPKTGLEIGYPTTIQGGHGNDIATDGDKIYVAWLEENETGVRTNKLTVCDTNFNYLYDINVTGIPYVLGIDYNRETQLFYLLCADTVYVYDRTLTVLQKSIALDFSYYRNYFSSSNYFQAQTITTLPEGFMVSFAHPNISVKFTECGKIDKIYNIENYENGFYNMEIEKVLYNPFDGYFYINSFARQGMGDIANNVYGRFNLKKGQVKYINTFRTTRPLLYSANRDAVAYVDGNISDNAKMLGTYEYPFKYVQQGIDCINASRAKAGRVYVKENSANKNLGTVCISGTKNIHVSTEKNIRYRIPELQIIHSNNIDLYWVDVDKARIANSGGLRFGHCNITIQAPTASVGNPFSLVNDILLYDTVLKSDVAEQVGFIGRTQASNTINIDSYVNCYDLGTRIS